jgi:nitrile hydratase subunit beta
VNGVHDLGGMHGFGPVVAEKDEPVFHAAWEAAVRGMQRATVGRYYNLDEFRYAIERMPPARYLEAGYYEKWLHALETLMLEKGIVTRGELAGGPLETAAPPPGPRWSTADRPRLEARFAPGDQVMTRVMNPKGHTRLPRYARGKRGVVRTVNGPFLLPDTRADLRSDDWQPVYAVQFTARELWGEGAGERDVVCIDCWESYLKSGE